jgi:hypothetical protein
MGFMLKDPKRDARKTEEAGLNAETQFSATVTKPDAPAERGKEAAADKARETTEKRRPRQDSLDRERASGEGMLPPSSNR